MDRKTWLVLIGLASLLPVWRSGGVEDMNFWGFVLNHTIFADGPEYVPEEDYQVLIERFVEN